MPKKRVGKTQKDKNSGAYERNANNKSLRADWCNDSKRSNDNFPVHTCNGKKNKRIVTGKGNSQVLLGKR